ncbi:MAG: hypothetical protein K1W34_04340 [Lachnospiraceae bacterium]
MLFKGQPFGADFPHETGPRSRELTANCGLYTGKIFSCAVGTPFSVRRKF